MQKPKAKVTKSFQVQVPQGVRWNLGVEVGGYVEFKVEDHAAVLKPAFTKKRGCHITKMSVRYQLSIPFEVLFQLGANVGQYLEFSIEKGDVTIRKVA